MIDPVDYFHVQQLIAKYGHYLDACIRDGASWDRFGGLFAADAVFDLEALGHGRIVGAGAIVEAMKQGIHPSGHHATNVLVHSASAEKVESSVKLLVVLPDGRACTGTYDDTIIKVDGEWRFACRRAMIRVLDPAAESPHFARRGEPERALSTG